MPMNTASILPPLCAAVFFLFYFTQIPVIVVLRVQSGDWGVGFGAFLWKYAIHRARKQKKQPPKKKIAPPKNARIKLLRFAARRTTLEYLRASGTLSLSDAHKTCLGVGFLRALCAALGQRGEAQVMPAFSENPCFPEIIAIFSMRMGHVICAAAIVLADILQTKLNRLVSHFG